MAYTKEYIKSVSEFGLGSPGIVRLLPEEDWVSRQIGTLVEVGAKNYKVGVAKPKFSQNARAIEAEGRYVDEMQKVLAEGRRVEGLKASSDEEWFAYCLKLGVDRLVPGVVNRAPEIYKFLAGWIPNLTKVVGELDKMPIDTINQRKGKVGRNIDLLMEAKGKWR